MRTLTARLLLLACVAVLALAPAAAAQNPFAPLPAPSGQTVTVPTTATSTTTRDNGGLERWQEILIFLAGVALIAGIGFAIVGDARKVAPVTEEDREGAHQRSHAAGARKAQSKAQSRKKGKAQRQARKANR